jgi:predicted regulator of Ras-like GTPase activity (Roadblock/LC7/MglB family)
METKAKSLEKILDDIESVGGIELSAIVSRQGLLIVSKEREGPLSTETFAALTATLFTSAESTSTRLSNQKPRSIIVETENKHIITYVASPDALIVVLVGDGEYMGMILNELREAAGKVNKLI